MISTNEGIWAQAFETRERSYKMKGGLRELLETVKSAHEKKLGAANDKKATFQNRLNLLAPEKGSLGEAVAAKEDNFPRQINVLLSGKTFFWKRIWRPKSTHSHEVGRVGKRDNGLRKEAAPALYPTTCSTREKMRRLKSVKKDGHGSSARRPPQKNTNETLEEKPSLSKLRSNPFVPREPKRII